MAGSGEGYVTVKDVYDVIDSFAPFDTQEDWDNSGLLAGTPDAKVTKVLCALDATIGAIEEAKRLNCELIVTHHPILFHARKNLREDDPEGKVLCALIRGNLSLIAAHTNFDIAKGGVNETLAQAVGLSDISEIGEGLRMGAWGGTLGELRDRASKSLGATIRVYGDLAKECQKVAVCGGAGGSLWKNAYTAGADAFITGEIHHNDALDMLSFGVSALEAGHYATEIPSTKTMKRGLQNSFEALQYRVKVFVSEYEPF